MRGSPPEEVTCTLGQAKEIAKHYTVIITQIVSVAPDCVRLEDAIEAMDTIHNTVRSSSSTSIRDTCVPQVIRIECFGIFGLN